MVGPERLTSADVESLRQAGLADADILAVAEVTSYYAYVNRIADGLGVQLEPWMGEGRSPPGSASSGP